MYSTSQTETQMKKHNRNTEVHTFTIHFRDELDHINTLSKVKEHYDLHSVCVLMRTFKNKYIRKPWWQRLFFLCAFLSFLSCDCLTQIPTQVIYADHSCQAILPDYTAKIMVRDNCGIAHLFQEPFPGTILDADNKQIQVVITAVDSSNNASFMQFDVIILDTIPPAMDLPEEMMSYSWPERHHLLSMWQHDTENKLKQLDPDFSKVINSTYIMLNMTADHKYWAVFQPQDQAWIPFEEWKHGDIWNQ